jgi:hypothetical protein
MSKYIYIIANLNELNEPYKKKWMTSTPFYYRSIDNKIHLDMLSDLYVSFLKPQTSVLKFSLFRILINDKLDFYKKREKLFQDTTLVNQLGFEKLTDIEYTVDENNKIQTYNNYEITFHYIKDVEKFGNSFYLSCPTIIF